MARLEHIDTADGLDRDLFRNHAPHESRQLSKICAIVAHGREKVGMALGAIF